MYAEEDKMGIAAMIFAVIGLAAAAFSTGYYGFGLVAWFARWRVRRERRLT